MNLKKILLLQNKIERWLYLIIFNTVFIVIVIVIIIIIIPSLQQKNQNWLHHLCCVIMLCFVNKVDENKGCNKQNEKMCIQWIHVRYDGSDTWYEDIYFSYSY